MKQLVLIHRGRWDWKWRRARSILRRQYAVLGAACDCAILLAIALFLWLGLPAFTVHVWLLDLFAIARLGFGEHSSASAVVTDCLTMFRHRCTQCPNTTAIHLPGQ